MPRLVRSLVKKPGLELIFLVLPELVTLEGFGELFVVVVDEEDIEEEEFDLPETSDSPSVLEYEIEQRAGEEQVLAELFRYSDMGSSER